MTSEAEGAGRPDRKDVVVLGPVPPFRGGIAQHTARIAEAIADRGDEVRVESWRSQYPRVLYRRAHTDPGAPALPGARFRLSWFDPVSWARAARRARGCDVLVIVWVTPFHAIPARVIARMAGARRTVAMVHNVDPHEPMPLQRPLTRLGLGGASAIVCHARSLADDLERLGAGVADTRVVPMPPLVDIDHAPMPPAPPVRLLFLGFQRHYKGPDIAIDALGRLVDDGRDVTLTIAGERWDPDADLTPRIEARGLGGRVTLLECYLDDAELADAIHEHHLLIAPYRTATQSGVVGMALAGGRPVVVTPVGGLPDAVVDGETGVVATAVDPASVADALGRAIDDLDRLARGVVGSRPRWSDVAAAIVGDP